MGDRGGSAFQSSVDEDEVDLSSAAISLPLKDTRACNYCQAANKHFQRTTKNRNRVCHAHSHKVS